LPERPGQEPLAPRAPRAEPPAPLWPLDGAWGYDGWAYRRLSHWLSAWALGLPAWLLLRSLYRVELRGQDQIGRLKPPLLLVSNHQSLLDSYFVCLLLGLVPHGLLHEWIVPYHTPEERNFLRGPLSRALHLALRCVPLRRGAGLHQAGLDQAAELLRRGRSLVYMFPEGTRSRTGHIGPATPGVGRVILRAGCPVLPLRIWGMDRVLPVGAKRPRLGQTLRIRVGPLLEAEHFAGLADGPRGQRRAADLALDAVKALDWDGPPGPGAPPGPSPRRGS